MVMSIKVPDIRVSPRSPVSSPAPAGQDHYFSESRMSEAAANLRRPNESRTQAHHAVCHLHSEIFGRRPGTILQLPGRPARIFRGLHPEPATGRLAGPSHSLRRWRILRWDHGAAGTEAFVGG